MALSIRPQNENVTDASLDEVVRLFDRSHQRQDGIENWTLINEEWDEFERITHTRSAAAFVDWKTLYESLTEENKKEIRRKNAPHLTVVRET